MKQNVSTSASCVNNLVVNIGDDGRCVKFGNTRALIVISSHDTLELILQIAMEDSAHAILISQDECVDDT